MRTRAVEGSIIFVVPARRCHASVTAEIFTIEAIGILGFMKLQNVCDI